MRRIGLMGGTFNPIHNGHLIIATYAKEQYGLDEVWFMTSANPPHKNASEITDASIRHAMVSKAIEGNKDFVPFDYELRRNERSYTVNTLRRLKEEYSETEFYFIVGQDSLHDFPKWYEPQEILKLAKVLVFPRDNDKLKAEVKQINKLYGGEIGIIDAPLIGISSTEIRKRQGEGLSIRYMIPEEVREYIEENGLYKEGKKMKEKLKAALKPDRYKHSLGVCDEAVKLAKRYGANEEKAYLAGLLHDCAKGYPKKRQIELCEEYGVELDEASLSCPAVIHAPLGAEVARRDYGIEDEEILEAIRCHTVGKSGMGLLDKIIYMADMIEPMRNFEGVEKLRKMAYKDLDAAMLEAIKDGINFNLNKPSVIHPATIDAWNDLLTKKEE